MARSFYRPLPENIVEDYRLNNRYYHKPSNTYFVMYERDGRYYQRRYQIGFSGKETNIDEKTVDFVMGSGNHVRSYLHRAKNGSLAELPVAWYAEKGGYWAMSPGYDRADQPNARRKISDECMFCHNAYPESPGKDEMGADAVFAEPLPQGIDCQRCHGPGGAHILAAQTAGASVEAIRGAIVNPSRLGPERQMEVCMQCHLETTSFPFPHSIPAYDRGPFSYVPGEPLSDFWRFFERPPAPQEDRFEIVNSAYRLRMSVCFLRSAGKLRCTTCHDPHNVLRDETAEAHYNSVCQGCHATALRPMVESGRHTASTNCIGCHMPKRRTDDVVHAVMTDHWIQRNQPKRDHLAEIPEPYGAEIVYHGKVVPYYPAPMGTAPEDELYLAVAQVHTDNNLAEGIVRLTAAIKRYRPRQAEFYVELADALQRVGKPDSAISVYQEALRREPALLGAWKGLGSAFERSSQLTKAAETFRRALRLAPTDALLFQELGQVYQNQGRPADALAALLKSSELDGDVPQTHELLGALRMTPGGDPQAAEAHFREAIRLQPDYAQANANLAILLARENRLMEAGYYFDQAIRLRPDYALARFNYGLTLVKTGSIEEARKQLIAISQSGIPSDPGLLKAAARLLDQIGKP